MSSFTVPRIIAGIFTQPYGPVRNVCLICCGLLMVSISSPTWWRWVSGLLPPRGSSLRPGPCGEDFPDGQVRSSNDEGNTPSRDEDVTSGDGDRSWCLAFPLSLFRWRRGPPRNKSAPPPAEYLMQILYDNSNAAIDIVAVHGLAANPDYAWIWQPKNNCPDRPGYPDKHFNWLKELLPTKLSCRVMAFNYDSNWFMNAPQQRLSNISDNLLISLRNNREKATNRPLIFIGHSFGGNLIEQAIVSASRHGSEYTDIAKSTVGVAFLGTPHRGSAEAAWGALIASLAPPQFAPEKRILEDLKLGSGTVTDLLHDFTRWLFVESVPVVCFFEQLMTDYSSRMGAVGNIIPFRRLVVPETSACIDGHHKISLNADHFKINKFYGPDDPSFKLVYSEIERMARGAEDKLRHRRDPKAIPMDESATSDVLRKCLQEMRVTNPLDIISDIQTQKGKRIGQTCEWILKQKDFSVWGAANNSKLLRFIGPPGIGKTMMSIFLVEVLKGKVEKSPDKAFAYFFCDDKNQERRTPAAILRSLIWQLLLQRNELYECMKPDVEKQKDNHLFEGLFENVSALWRIFQNMLRDERAGEVFILIDALDECDRSTRKALLRGIRELFEASAESAGNFKFLVTCRPEISDIEYELDEVGVPLRMDSSEAGADVSEYINFRVMDLAQRKEYSNYQKENVKRALEKQAGGTFLWVSLMINELKSTPKYNVAAKLENLPKGLDETYIRILEENIPKERQEDARFLLLSMVAARRPLTKKELAASFACWKTGSVMGNYDLPDYLDICLSCSSIIYFDRTSSDDETVNFCHQSVKDFLLDDHSGSSGAWYHASPDGANILMFEVCWRYLSSDVFSNGRLVVYRENNMLLGRRNGPKMFRGSDELITHIRQYSFLGYASSEWENHAIVSYPKELNVDTDKAPTLRDAWLLRTSMEGGGHKTTVKLLLGKGANVESTDEDGRTPLSWAAGNGHNSIVKLLLDKDANVESKDVGGRTPLSWASGNEHSTTVKLLLGKGANVESKDLGGWTPLSLAVAPINLDKGSTVPIPDYHIQLLFLEELNRKSLMMFRQGQEVEGRKVIFKLLLEKGVDVELLLSVISGSLGEESRNALRNYRTLHTIRRQQNSMRRVGPYRDEESEGRKAVVKLLLENGANIEAYGEDGQTPLWSAAENRYEAIVELLLEKGANIDAKAKNGLTSLWWAIGERHEAMARLLLKGANVNLRNKDGWTPLSWAAGNGLNTIVMLLLEKGADIEAKAGDGLTPLWHAAGSGHEDTVKLLLEKGANINIMYK